MCGRFTLAYEDWGAMLDYWGIGASADAEVGEGTSGVKAGRTGAPDFRDPPRYNIAPGQDIAAIVAGRAERRIGYLRWGLTPSGMATRPVINARAETVAEKPMFRGLLSRRRCVIPADGFFEWRTMPGGKKQPYRIVVKDRPFFGFAGLYNTFVGGDGNRVSTCAIVTTKPNELMGDIHNRMPVILTRDREDIWLDPSVTEKSRLTALLQPYDAADMRAYPVSAAVGQVRNDGAELLDAVGPDLA